MCNCGPGALVISHHCQEGVLNLESLAAIFSRFPKQPLGKDHNWLLSLLGVGDRET